MPVSFSEFLLSLRTDAAHAAFAGFNPAQTRLRFQRGRRASFHLVLAGETVATLHDDGQRVSLRAGDFVLFARGDAHDIGEPEAPTQVIGEHDLSPAEEPRELRFGSGAVRLLTGRFGLEQFRDEATTSAIPALIILPLGREPAFAGLFGGDDLEALSRGPGGRAFVAAAVRLLYIEAMRRTFEELSVSDPVSLRKLGISQIAVARRLIHADPGRTWTLAEMAQAVGMSRSVFARRFHEVVGETPQHYLAGVRFSRASDLIEGGASIAEAAAHVGYASPSAFTRAFGRRCGGPPSQTNACKQDVSA